MPKYLITYHIPVEMLENCPEPTPGQFEEGMKVWHDWRDRLGEHLIDLGAPLSFPVRVNGQGLTSNHKSTFAGYSIVQAEDMNQVKELVNKHPHLGWTEEPYLEIHEMTIK